MGKFLEKRVRVKFQGGREGEWVASVLVTVRRTEPINIVSVCILSSAAAGILKGFDPLLNLVLDDTVEYLRGVYVHARALHYLHAKPYTQVHKCKDNYSNTA